jgi:hypothetical protein
VADRAIFNRKYTSFTPAGTQVWLANGAGVTTTFPTSRSFTAGESLNQGQVVYVSGTAVFAASAASGVPAYKYQAIGITAEAASVTSGVAVIFDDLAVLNSSNITAESSLVPGEYYYLSKYTGQVTRYATSSGLVSASGTYGYQVLAAIGTALSSSELQVEIEQPVIIYS